VACAGLVLACRSPNSLGPPLRDGGPDAGPPLEAGPIDGGRLFDGDLVDGDLGDAASCAGTGVAEIDLRFVTGFDAALPLDSVRVRAQASCAGDIVEMVSDVEGRVHLSLDRMLGTWDVTAVRSEYRVVSILEISEFAFAGDVYLVPVTQTATATTEVMHEMSGTVAGVVPPGGSITISVSGGVIDEHLASAGAWSMPFFDAPAHAALPIDVVAILHDMSGRALNIAHAERVTTGADIRDVDLFFPDPPVTPLEIAYRVTAYEIEPAASADLRHEAPGYYGRRGVTSGAAKIEYEGDGDVALVALVTAETFPGVLSTDWVVTDLDSAAGAIRFVQHDLAAPASVFVPGETRSIIEGDDLSTLVVVTDGPRGPDETLVVEVGPPGDPLWRVFAPTVPAEVRLPTLPGGMTLADIGLPTELDEVVGYYMRMRTIAPWSSPQAEVSFELGPARSRPDFVYTEHFDALGFAE
jgi:hypothetical protein